MARPHSLGPVAKAWLPSGLGKAKVRQVELPILGLGKLMPLCAQQELVS